MLVAMWECQWSQHKDKDADVMTFMRRTCDKRPACAPYSFSGVFGTNSAREDAVVKVITDGSLFGMALVDINIPEGLKEKFHDMPPIDKSATVDHGDIGDFMKLKPGGSC